MKTTKIPGLGRFGTFIDDIDMNTISDEEWMEIGQIHVDSLVTILRNVKCDTVQRYEYLISLWGAPRFNRPYHMYEKYGKKEKELVLNNELEEADRQIVMNVRNWQVHKKYSAVRISPKKDSRDRNIGIFGSGDLKWHSNECGDVMFTPGVSLLGRESMVGSSTGFLTTVDWYESQSESFRKELDEMIIVHNYRDSMISEIIVEEQESFYRNNMCPEKDSRVPLVIKSPYGHKGIHLGINTFDKIEGVSKEESDEIFSYIEKTLFVPEYTYQHWYQQDNDLCLFDNSVTLHNRMIKDEVAAADRIGWRLQFDFDNVVGKYSPYFQEEFNQSRHARIEKLLELVS